MNLIFELSKEHINLPKNEIISCLKSENIPFTILESNENILLIKSDISYNIIRRIANRLSYTFYISELLFVSVISTDKITKNSIKNSLDVKGTIAIRCKNISESINSQEIIKTLAKVYAKNRYVNLSNPDIEIRAFITDSKLYVGKKICVMDRSQYEKRKVQFRPYFSPISLHPKIARALVNLSSIKKNEILLDPFCGTGGILLEAGLIGAKIIGSDIEEKMINGSKKTLDFYKIKKYQLFCSDIGDIKKHIDFVDAIVTDLPYGKATTTKGEDMKKLYKRTFKIFVEILKEKKKLVIGISDKKWVTKLHLHLKLIDIYEIRAHKSLTRFFAVFEKRP